MSQYGDEPCSVYDVKERVARKAHKCSACGERVEPGTKYTDVFMVHEGEPYTCKRCPRCQVIYLHLEGRIRAEGDYDWFCDERLNCGHEYEERSKEAPPEWLAALAFWLPGDPLPIPSAMPAKDTSAASASGLAPEDKCPACGTPGCGGACCAGWGFPPPIRSDS